MGIEALVGTAITVLLGVCAYFFNRLITQYDEFQSKTSKDFQAIRRTVERVDTKVDESKRVLANRIEAAGLSKETKRKISSTSENVSQIKIDLDSTVKPSVQEAKKYHGKIIVIEDNLKAQETKLSGLYKIMEAIVKASRK